MTNVFLVTQGEVQFAVRDGNRVIEVQEDHDADMFRLAGGTAEQRLRGVCFAAGKALLEVIAMQRSAT